MCGTLRAAPRCSRPRLAQLPPPSRHPARPGPASVADPCWRGWRVGLCPLGAWKCPYRVADSRGWVSRAPHSTSCLLGFADSSRVLVGLSVFLLPASYLLTWVAGHLVPPLSPLAPCLQSPLFSHLCPLSLVLSLQPPAPLEFPFTIHLACPALTPSAHGSGSPIPPPSISPGFLTAFSSCFHLFQPCPLRVTFLVQPQYPISSACPIPRPLLPRSPVTVHRGPCHTSFCLLSS